MREPLIRVILLTTLDTPQAECEEDERWTDADARASSDSLHAVELCIIAFLPTSPHCYSSSPPESGDP